MSVKDIMECARLEASKLIEQHIVDIIGTPGKICIDGVQQVVALIPPDWVCQHPNAYTTYDFAHIWLREVIREGL